MNVKECEDCASSVVVRLHDRRKGREARRAFKSIFLVTISRLLTAEQ